jgi:RNA polymerase sigma-70 factor (ECF subfamily)
MHSRRELFAANGDNAPATTSGGVVVVPGASVPAGIESLFALYGDPVLNYCYYRLGNWQDAEDSAQQIFAKAMSALDRFRSNGCDAERSLRAWLFTIAHHEIANRHRYFARHHDASLDQAHDLHDPGPSPEELAIAADSQDRVIALFSRLSPDQRRVLELRLAGLTDTEIASVLGTSSGAVRATLFRAIARLRSLLGVTTVETGARNV